IVAQDYAVPSGERRTRIGMLAAVRAEPFATRRVRPHEQTHSAPKADRLALLRATGANLESIFLLAPDPDRTLAQALVKGASGVGRDAAKLVAAWREWFEVGRVAPCMDRVERLAELGRERTACIVAFPDAYDVTLVLKNDAALDRVPDLGKTPAVRALDVARI